MGFLGIDLGNWSCHVIHEVFTVSRTDVKTQISKIKCLLGRKFSDPKLQLELDYVPFRVIEGPDGYPLVHGKCGGEDRAFSPVEILAMLFSTPEFLGRQEYCDSSHSPCIGIPMYFTDQQKKDVLQAAKIAGLSTSFRLLDETTAMVVEHEEHPLLEPQRIVAFVDIGHASMQVCFAVFKRDSSTIETKRSVNILYKGYARSLGGREFDKVLFNHFASKIREEYNIDVYERSSACVRLSEACETMKNNLSIHNEASYCIKKFSGSIDVNVSITRKDFEGLSISILKNIEAMLNKALNESGLNVLNIDLALAVGKGCSIPAITDILTKIFGIKLRMTTFNAHVARGCAMQAEHLQITGTPKQINNLTTTLETSQFLWRRAMDEEGHLLTFLNDFLEKNMLCIQRPEKTMEELYWFSKGKYVPEYRYSELQTATNNFDKSFKLGEGGFAIVYKGIHNEFHITSAVAIKKPKEGNNQGEREFKREVKILSKVWHPNLVKLIGACTEAHAFIYEYQPNGSLEDRLRCKNNTPPLSWQTRVHIALEICSALRFLHCIKPHGIVHGDLKPDNILLDENNTSKICDFGLCRELNWTDSASIPYYQTEIPKGTRFYMDPEYFSTGKITPQVDVYSFGILLLRLATCKNPRGIRPLVDKEQKNGRLKALIDASAGSWPFKEAKKIISMGLRCSDPIRKNRPDLSTKVWKELMSMSAVASTSVSL